MNKFSDIPKTWEELVGLRDYITDCDAHFLRLPKDNASYAIYSKSISRKEIVNNIYGEMGKDQTAVLLNKFPHTNILKNLPKIRHYCLWSKTGPLSKKQIEEIINMQFKNEKSFYMERKVNHKSIPEIWHCHIFVETDSWKSCII